MKICHLYSHSHENQVIFMILMRNVLHKHSFCKWKLRRWKSKSAYTLFRFRRMCCFSGPGWIFLFFCRFWAENVLVLFLNYSLWHFRFRSVWYLDLYCVTLCMCSIAFSLQSLEWIRITRSLYANEAHNILITSFCTHEIVFTLECTAIIKIWAWEFVVR